MKAYEDLVDAGSEWLDYIPSHWRMARLDQVARTWPSNVNKHSVDGEMPVRLCNYTDVYKNAAIVEGIDFMAATAPLEQVEKFRIARGDTLVTKDSETADDIGVPAYVEYEADDLVCGYHLSMIRPRAESVVPRFLYWAMGARPIAGQWAVLATGVTRVGIKSGDLAKAAIALPPLDEQRAIADYLDRETARIDALIEEQQRLVEMLRERRWSVIERAVALLDWNTPFKAVTLLIQTGPFGSQLKSDEYVEGGTPVINPSHVIAGEIVPDLGVAVGSTKAAELARHALKKGDLIVARRGELGRCAVVQESAVGYLCGTGSALIRVDGRLVDPSFAAVVFRSMRNRDALELASVGSTMDNLNSAIIGSLRIPVPSLDDQRRLVDDIDKQTRKIDELIIATDRFIELSRERRTALITAAVTGKIDVRDEVA